MMFMSRHTLTDMLLDICKLLLQLGAQHGLGRGTSLILFATSPPPHHQIYSTCDTIDINSWTDTEQLNTSDKSYMPAPSALATG